MRQMTEGQTELELPPTAPASLEVDDLGVLEFWRVPDIKIPFLLPGPSHAWTTRFEYIEFPQKVP